MAGLLSPDNVIKGGQWLGGLLNQAEEGVKRRLKDPIGELNKSLLGDIYGAQDGEIGMPGVGLAGMLVRHSSPNIWTPGDTFSMNRLSEGEGTQAFGHGAYFAQNPKTAESYYKKFAKNDKGSLVHPDGSSLNTHTSYLDQYENTAIAALREADGDYAKAAALIRNSNNTAYPEDYNDSLPIVESVLKDWRKAGFEYKPSSASTYQFDLPDAELPSLLDLDKRMSRQAPEMQDRIMSVLDDDDYLMYKDIEKGYDPELDTGYSFLKDLEFSTYNQEGPQQAAEFMDTLGIKGTKFKDAASRDKQPYEATLINKETGQEVKDYFGSPDEVQGRLAQFPHLELKSIKEVPLTRNFAIWNQGLLNDMPMLERLK